MTQTRLERLNISFTKRNASRRGPTSSEKWNDSFDEISKDLSELYNNWNNFLYALTSTIPDGTVDSDIDAFENGLDGQTLYVKSDSTVSDTTYYSAGNGRPNTIYEQFSNLYTYVDNLNSTLSGQISSRVFSAPNISILDNAGLFTADNVEDALEEVKDLVDNFLNEAVYLPLAGGTMTGNVTMGTNSLLFGTGLVKVLSGAGSPEGAVTASPGSIYMNTSGGGSTSLYIKETGVGNTGWVGK